MDQLIVKGAREHNLKDIDITLPKNKLIVITGLSGSGKSTLAFDTIYAEGQRRYVESLSAYARQFLGMMNKPDVDSIEGLSPAISIEQKSSSKNPRSTVGTVTEIYDYLRLLFARIGVPHCPKCKKKISMQSTDSIVNSIMQNKDAKLQILAPIIRSKKGTHEKLLEELKKEGFVRARVDGKIIVIGEEKVKMDRYVKHNIEAVVDRIKVTKDNQSRVQDSVEIALKRSNGFVIVLFEENEKKDKKKKEKKEEKDKKEEKRERCERRERLFSKHFACSDCDINFEELQPRMFSFNSPFGACDKCHGLGYNEELSVDLLIPDKSLSLMDGAIEPFRMHFSWIHQKTLEAARDYGIDVFKPIAKVRDTKMNMLLEGDEDYEGLIPRLERIYRDTESDGVRDRIRRYMQIEQCPTCKGKRLNDKSRSVLINDKNIIDVTQMSIKYCKEFFDTLELTEKEKMISKQVLKEIRARLDFLVNVGLDYLTLSRSANTLSGGEAQRIRLATQIGSNLTGVLYILDEPSIGLHQRDNNRLIDTLTKLRDLGNTVIVVEHDEDTIRTADYIVDIGPGAGIHGGEVVAHGPIDTITNCKDSITASFLNGKDRIDVPKKRREPKGHLIVRKASANNLKNIDAKIPLGVFCVVTGVSGSGKSTLINQTLCKGLRNQLSRASEKAGAHEKIEGIEQLDKVIVIDQSPIGRTPRSNPATYIGVFTYIRELFAALEESKMRGYRPGRFSFNVKDGRCDECEGDGQIKIEMNFLPDIYITCDQCKGKRFNQETLQIKYKGKTISDVLAMSVEEGLEFFKNVPRIKRKLQTLFDVGLGYIKLGQSATTLSGGEAQRVKLTSELSKRGTGQTVYILDEPTTGLHFADIKKLLDVLNRLTDKGNTVLVIEHNLDVIKTADHVIDLGPEGGDEGGRIVAQGTPEQVAKVKESYTGQFLAKVLHV